MNPLSIWNPWHGCRKYSEGCENCYMYYLDSKRGSDGSEIYRVKTSFDLPLRKNRSNAYKIPDGTDLHVCLTSDFFLEEADPWRGEVWDMIRTRRGVHFHILTKRAERIKDNLPDDWDDGYENVTLSVTAENQKRADERLPLLFSVPARRRGVMIAPILSQVDLSAYLPSGMIDEVLADGENYDGARPCRYEWIKLLSEQCAESHVPFTFCGTGNLFVKDGRTYRIPKAYQSVQALRSALSYPPPEAVPDVEPRCASCKRRNECSGCTCCGDCKEHKLF